MSRFTHIVVVAGLGLAVTMPAASGESGGEERAHRTNRQRAMDEVSKVIDGYLLSHVQDALGLSEEEATEVVPLIVKHQACRRAHFERRNRLVGEMRKAFESGSATEAKIGELMKEIRSLEIDEAAKLRKAVEAIDEKLTVVQQAKFRVLEQDVHRRMGEMRDTARRKQRLEDNPQGRSPSR